MRYLAFPVILIWVATFISTTNIAAAQQQSGGNKQIRDLELGKPIERELAPADTHSYRIGLKAGEFLRLVVNSRGIDVIAALYDPGAQKISQVYCDNGSEGELIRFETKISGSHRLEVRAEGDTVPPGRYEVRIEEILAPEQYAACLAARRDTLDAVRHWIASSAIPLRTVVAGNGFDDMKPLDKLIGSAHLVALGEATHGTREFFQLKHRMLEFLVNEMGFTVFAIEATMPEAFDINEYVLTGEGDPEKALAGLYMWVWDTEEVLDMIKWMRSYNADPRHTKKVKFYGFDMQSAPRAVKVTLDNLRRFDASQAATLVKPLAVLANPFTAPDFVHLPKERKEETAAAVSTMLRLIEEIKLDCVNRYSESAWAIVRQQARIIDQHVRSQMNKAKYINIDPGVRDSSMAENIRWILDHEGPGSKMVVWAHNGHIGMHTTMGKSLRRMLGDDMVVIGFSFNQGSFQATELPFSYNQYFLYPSDKGSHPFTVSPAPDVSLDAILADAGLKVAAIDLRALPKEGPVATWFRHRQQTRHIGSAYTLQSADYGYDFVVAPQAYDALFFVESTAAAFPNEGGKRPGAAKLSVPANLDFESGEPGKTPPSWLVPQQSRDFDFSVTTSEDEPHTGKRCALISRNVGKHYGEMYGNLSQQINAISYRGKKVRLRAAVRTDVSGAGSQAYLWLRVTRNFFGPAALLFQDNMADRPIKIRNWQDFEIDGRVPQDAQTIGYGLALVGEGRAWLDSVTLEVVE